MFISAHLSSATVTAIGSASKVRGDPGHSPGVNTRCAQSHGRDRAGGFRWRCDRSSPTTFYPCELSRPSPDALCVFRRPLEGPEEATPSLRRRAAQARNFPGSPPPASKPQCDTASPKRFPLLEHCSLWDNPRLKEAPQGKESLTGHRHNPHPAQALATAAKALATPDAQGALWLPAPPTPCQLHRHPAPMPVARFGDPLFPRTLTALLWGRREAR
jgi:hypothetical protein